MRRLDGSLHTVMSGRYKQLKFGEILGFGGNLCNNVKKSDNLPESHCGAREDIIRIN